MVFVVYTLDIHEACAEICKSLCHERISVRFPSHEIDHY